MAVEDPTPPPPEAEPPASLREMLARLRRGGVSDQRVMAAMAAVPREEFVLEGSESLAHDDRALPIGYGQTISQPLIVATMVAALELSEGDRALDVGTGSGYMAAVMTACGARVVSIERIERLAAAARRRLARLGYEVEVRVGDGSLGCAEAAPWDAIAVGAAAPRVPSALLSQLADGGRMVLPVTSGPGGEQLIRVRREADRMVEESMGACRFVPLVGAQGFDDEEQG